MKKLIALILAAMFVFAVASCGNEPAQSTPTESTPAESTPGGNNARRVDAGGNGTRGIDTGGDRPRGIDKRTGDSRDCRAA